MSEAPITQDEPFVPPEIEPGPFSYLSVQASDGLVMGVSTYDQPRPEFESETFVLATDEQLAAIQQPGTHYLEADGTIRTEPPPPPPLRYTGTIAVDAQIRTTDDAVTEIYRITMDTNVIHQAELKIIGIDAVSFVTRAMVGHFVHRRRAAGAIQVGIYVVSDVPNPPAPPSNAWAPNAMPSGNDVVFTVKGAAGRTIDWTLSGEVFAYAPAGK